MNRLFRCAAVLVGLLAVFVSLTALAPAQDPPSKASQKKGTISKKQTQGAGKKTKADDADEKMPPRDSDTANATGDEGEAASDETHDTAKALSPDDPNAKVFHTDAEWRRLLTREQYWVTREKGTEPAFSGRYASGRHKGVFTCVGCGAALFSSNHKFESGTGWPSFYQPVNRNIIATAPDFSDPNEARVEVMCARCEAHLGHVFEDGPAPTGLRFCINSVALRLKPFPSTTDASKAKSASKSATPKKAAAAKKSSADRPAQNSSTGEDDRAENDDADTTAAPARKSTSSPTTKRSGSTSRPK